MTTLSKFARTTLISAVASLALVGAASATADISTTGPDSYNTIETTSSNHVDLSNTNNVTVNNNSKENNNQTASTGDASVTENTTGGSAISGNANNSNSVATTISIDNSQSPCNCGKGGDGGSIGGSGGGTSHVGGGGSKAVGGGSQSVGILPETGAHSPVDVTALRNLLNPASTTTPLSGAVKSGKTLSVVVLALAAILSLLGAISTAVYSTKRTLKV